MLWPDGCLVAAFIVLPLHRTKQVAVVDHWRVVLHRLFQVLPLNVLEAMRVVVVDVSSQQHPNRLARWHIPKCDFIDVSAQLF
jgi:hypothetical protein